MTTSTALSLSDSARARRAPGPVKQAILDQINSRPCGGNGVGLPTPLGEGRANGSLYRWFDDGTAVCESRSGHDYLLSWSSDPERGRVASECSCPSGSGRGWCRHTGELQTAMTEHLTAIIVEAANAAAEYERTWLLHRLGLATDDACNGAYRRLERARAAADKAIARDTQGGTAALLESGLGG